MSTNEGFLCGPDWEWEDDSESDRFGRFDGPCLVLPAIQEPPPPPAFGPRPTMDHYQRALRHFDDHPDRAGALTHLRELTIQGLRAGTLLESGQQQFLDLLDAAPDDAVWMHGLIRLAGDGLQPQTRRAAYGRLADVSEPEVVWSLALAYAGSIEALPPEIRASMAEGSAEPLAERLRVWPFRDVNAGVNAAAVEMRREEVLDRPLPWLH
ncbi:hypothetical protein [Catenulispora sp. MAP12-49]|uniref:hypothetical protein n=1 Tax=Catenulispora sp. MAP12-49 TaxID=3156302 RepID=UPI003517E5FC